jgi:tripartite-type tricarboxylate transporter receptor subunit TctC
MDESDDRAAGGRPVAGTGLLGDRETCYKVRQSLTPNREDSMRTLAGMLCRGLAACALAVAVGLTPGVSPAQDYPNKPIRLVVPFPPGGGVDFLARTVQPKLQEGLGVPVLIEYKAGASARIGAEFVAKSPPDGYTLLLGNIQSHGMNPAVFKALPYDPQKDFAPISLAVNVNFFLVVHPSLGVNSVKELIAMAKANPGKLHYASAGSGSAPHLAMELLKSSTGIDIVHVPYKGGGQAVTDVLGGQVPMIVGDLPTFLPHVKAGKLKALAVVGPKRSPLLPEVPTMAEAAVPGFSVTSWQGLLAPAGTPEPIVRRLHAEFVKVLRMPDVADKLAQGGSDPVASTPEEFAAFIRAENERWIRVARTAGVTPE